MGIGIILLNKGTKTIKWKEQCDKCERVDMEISFSQKDIIKDRNSLVRVGECLLFIKSTSDWYRRLKRTTVLEFKKEDSTRYSKENAI